MTCASEAVLRNESMTMTNLDYCQTHTRWSINVSSHDHSVLVSSEEWAVHPGLDPCLHRTSQLISQLENNPGLDIWWRTHFCGLECIEMQRC